MFRDLDRKYQTQFQAVEPGSPENVPIHLSREVTYLRNENHVSG